jgi:hypothetical protein
MLLTFTEADIKLISFPHTDAMVITTHIEKWNATRNIEQGFAPGHRNINCLQDEKTESGNDTSAIKS